MGYSKG